MKKLLLTGIALRPKKRSLKSAARFFVAAGGRGERLQEK
jgi:hypothetical protein